MKYALVVCAACILLVFAAIALGTRIHRPILAFESHHSGNGDIFLWDGGRVLNISRHPLDDIDPAWSPDGRLAFVSYRGDSIDIYIYDLRTGALTRVPNPARADLPAADMQPAWSNDGRLAFISSRSGNFDVFIYDPRDASLTNVSAELLTNDESPTWSSDGRLAFVSSGLGAADVYVYDPHDASLTNVTQHSLSQDWLPAWSPAGRLAYLSYRGTINMQVYLANGNGVSTRLSELHAQVSVPTWSADGAQLAFAAFVERGNTEVYVVDVATGATINVSNHPTWDGSPQWAPDGGLSFVSNRSGSLDILVYDPQTGSVTNLTRRPSNESDFAWLPQG